MPIWHYRGRYVGESNPKHWHVCDGKWVDTNSLRADGGWQEIEAKLVELCPDGRPNTRNGTRPAPRLRPFLPVDQREGGRLTKQPLDARIRRRSRALVRLFRGDQAPQRAGPDRLAIAPGPANCDESHRTFHTPPRLIAGWNEFHNSRRLT
jgi:hypothetical protein